MTLMNVVWASNECRTVYFDEFRLATPEDPQEELDSVFSNDTNWAFFKSPLLFPFNLNQEGNFSRSNGSYSINSNVGPNLFQYLS